MPRYLLLTCRVKMGSIIRQIHTEVMILNCIEVLISKMQVSCISLFDVKSHYFVYLGNQVKRNES